MTLLDKGWAWIEADTHMCDVVQSITVIHIDISIQKGWTKKRQLHTNCQRFYPELAKL